MKKLLILLLAIMMLAGCSSAKRTHVVGMSTLYNAVDQAAEIELPEAKYNNAKKQYYTYYIPRGIGRQERNATSNLFTIFGNNAVLNLDVASIVQASHQDETNDGNVRSRLRGIGSFAYTTFRKEGAFTNSSNKNIQYRILVGEFADDMSYIIIQTEHFNFSSVCPVMETDEMIYEMIKILRTCTVNEKSIVEDYSYIEDTSETFNVVSLFKEMLPEIGYVVDYIEDWKNDRSFTLIDYTHDTPEDPGIEGDDVSDDLSTDDDIEDNTEDDSNGTGEQSSQPGENGDNAQQ